MSKIGNYLLGLQESEDFQFGWESAERGQPKPEWEYHTGQPAPHSSRLNEQRLGWEAWHAAESIR